MCVGVLGEPSGRWDRYTYRRDCAGGVAACLAASSTVVDFEIELEERVGLLSMGTADEDVEGGSVVVNALQEAPDGVLGEGAVDPVYEAKARVLNKAIQEIGMGRYQWQVSGVKARCSCGSLPGLEYKLGIEWIETNISSHAHLSLSLSRSRS